jgi:hypothetical protein
VRPSAGLPRPATLLTRAQDCRTLEGPTINPLATMLPGGWGQGDVCSFEDTDDDFGDMPETPDPQSLPVDCEYGAHADWATFSPSETSGLEGFLFSENQVTPL